MKRDTCSHCGNLFRARAGKRFCSDACRYAAWASGGAGLPSCAYCGVPATSTDHVPPRSARQRIVDLGLCNQFKFQEVPCCAECNSVLGARALWTVTQRKRFIKAYLKRKYRKYINMPSWDGEPDTVKGRLRSYVVASQITRDVVRSRLSW